MKGVLFTVLVQSITCFQFPAVELSPSHYGSKFSIVHALTPNQGPNVLVCSSEQGRSTDGAGEYSRRGRSVGPRGRGGMSGRSRGRGQDSDDPSAPRQYRWAPRGDQDDAFGNRDRPARGAPSSRYGGGRSRPRGSSTDRTPQCPHMHARSRLVPQTPGMQGAPPRRRKAGGTAAGAAAPRTCGIHGSVVASRIRM
jgi:hypothetical protein